ncbi:cyclin-dependent kinase 2-interacting protein isoform 1-T2 [Polymixia lowei]
MEALSCEGIVTSGGRKCSAVTGSARKIKDNAADWHNLIIRWEKLNDEGSSVANRIINLRLKEYGQATSTPNPDQNHNPISTSLLPILSSQRKQPSMDRHSAKNTELEEECSKLLDIVDKMVGIVAKMERLLASQRGIMDLEEFQFGAEGRQAPLFHSWPTAQFVKVSCQMFDAYSQELRLKNTILQELAHTVTSDLSMVYLSCWVYQPYIQPQTRLTLEALLLETGHRPL